MKILVRSIRIVPMILVMGTIFFLSHQPGTDLPLPYFPGLDKLVHATAYACLAAATLYALPDRLLSTTKPLYPAIIVVFFCMVYGMSDEYHQSFIPGREPSFGDLLADTVGAALLAGAWLKYNPFSTSKKNPDQQIRPLP